MKRESPTAAYMRENWAPLVQERDRLKAVLDYIAESVIVSVVTAPDMTPSKDKTVRFIQTVTRGCGICQGEFHRDQDREWYDHKDWCPRKTA